MESLDLSILRTLYAGGAAPLWVNVALAVSFLGSGWLLIALVPALFARDFRAPAVAALVTVGVTSGVVALVKALVGRSRPCHALAWANVLPIDLPSDCSFPSGHAAGSFAFASLVFARRPRAGAMLFGLAALIALTRVILGMHYPSDVVAGAALGSAFGLAGARIFQPRRAPSPSGR